MSVTVELSVQESSVLEGRPARFLVLFTNGGGDDLAVSSYAVEFPLGAPVNESASFSFAGGTQVVPAAGSLYASFSAAFYPRTFPQEGDTDQWGYAVKVTAYTDDGAYTESNTVDVQVTPVTSEVQAMPLAGLGQMRFDSNNNSALFPVLL